MLYGLGTVILEEASAQADEKKNALAWLIERNLAELLDYKALLAFRSAFHPVMQLAAKAPSNPPELYEGEGSFQALQQFRWSSPGIHCAMTFLGKYPGVEDFGSFRYDDPATIINGEFECVVKRN